MGYGKNLAEKRTVGESEAVGEGVTEGVPERDCWGIDPVGERVVVTEGVTD